MGWPQALTTPYVNINSLYLMYSLFMLDKDLKETGVTIEDVERTMGRIHNFIDSEFILLNGITQTQIALISAAINLSGAFNNSIITEKLLQHALAELEKDRYVTNGNKLN